jgi:nanoRNase/pAp phosphatase (c-di-AMP/oligoRNAs hydrolase)
MSLMNSYSRSRNRKCHECEYEQIEGLVDAVESGLNVEKWKIEKDQTYEFSIVKFTSTDRYLCKKRNLERIWD